MGQSHVQDCATKRDLAVLSEAVRDTNADLAVLRSDVKAGFHAMDLRFCAMDERFDALTAEVARKADALRSTH
jgi:hypothetical protein